MSAEPETFVGGWMLVELMGHRVVAGHVVPVNVVGAGMLRITVPCEPPVIMCVRPESIYCLTDIDEAEARRRSARPPVQVMTFDHPVLPARASRAYGDDSPDEYDGHFDPYDELEDDEDDTDDDEEPDPEVHYAVPGSYEDVEEGDY